MSKPVAFYNHDIWKENLWPTLTLSASWSSTKHCPRGRSSRTEDWSLPLALCFSLLSCCCSSPTYSALLSPSSVKTRDSNHYISQQCQQQCWHSLWLDFKWVLWGWIPCFSYLDIISYKGCTFRSSRFSSRISLVKLNIYIYICIYIYIHVCV